MGAVKNKYFDEISVDRTYYIYTKRSTSHVNHSNYDIEEPSDLCTNQDTCIEYTKYKIR